jgi:hypothetical protein
MLGSGKQAGSSSLPFLLLKVSFAIIQRFPKWRLKEIQHGSLMMYAVCVFSTVLKGLAYPVNGIIMGGLDWKFTMAGECAFLLMKAGITWYATNK